MAWDFGSRGIPEASTKWTKLTFFPFHLMSVLVLFQWVLGFKMPMLGFMLRGLGFRVIYMMPLGLWSIIASLVGTQLSDYVPRLANP